MITFKETIKKGIRITINKDDILLGFIDIVIDIETKEMDIIELYVEEKYRGHKYGSMLIDHVIEKSKINNILVINVDDMSDRYRQFDNIYLKNGFKYVDEDGPEMVYLC
jgi:GNAT superfamily N-acetyltransferase